MCFCKSEVTGKQQSANRSKVGKCEQAGGRERATSERWEAKRSGEEVEKVNKSPLKQIAAIIHTLSNSETDSVASEKMSEENSQMTNLPPMKTPICYSVNHIKVLQALCNFTFAAQFETDEFLRKSYTW